MAIAGFQSTRDQSEVLSSAHATVHELPYVIASFTGCSVVCVQASAVIWDRPSAGRCTIVERSHQELRDGCRDLAQGAHGGQASGDVLGC